MQSCKKDAIGSSFSKSLTWTNPVCEPAVDSTLVPNVPAVIIEEGSQFKYPSFNPNNQYEIVYFEQEADSGSTPSEIGKLVKYNYQSGTKNVLVANVELSGAPTWNDNGWIAFETASSHIYIVRENGANLTQFTTHNGFNGFNQHISWVNGSNTLLWKYVNVGSGNSYLLQKTIGQQQTDTLFYGNIGLFSVSSANVLLSADGIQLHIMDLNQNPLSLQNYSSTLNGLFYRGLSWHPNANKFYISQIGSFDTAGLFEVDFATGNTTRIVEYCQDWVYAHISIAPNGNRLAIQKMKSDQYGIARNSSIWLLDLSTLQETKLPLE